MSKNLPNVFIIGSQKSATTSLATLLSKNPDVCLSEPKEPNYYSVNYDKGQQWYLERFSNPDKVLIDASTTYTMLPLTNKSLIYKNGRSHLKGIPERIYHDSPDAKLIYIIRDPVKRMYSNYWHNVKYGYENKPFIKAIKDDPLYIETSLYYEQIKQYLKFYNRENILILKFEDFINNQLDNLNICERFIGVSESQYIHSDQDENKGRLYGIIGRFLIATSLGDFIDKIMPHKVRTVLRNLITKDIPRLSNKTYKELIPVFRDDQKRFYEIFKTGYFY